MTKQNIGITAEDLFSFQKAKGKSLIHRCCGKSMTRVKNIDLVKQGEFYLCSENCGKAEIPYIAQILGYNPKSYYGR